MLFNELVILDFCLFNSSACVFYLKNVSCVYCLQKLAEMAEQVWLKNFKALLKEFSMCRAALVYVIFNPTIREAEAGVISEFEAALSKRVSTKTARETLS